MKPKADRTKSSAGQEGHNGEDLLMRSTETEPTLRGRHVAVELAKGRETIRKMDVKQMICENAQRKRL